MSESSLQRLVDGQLRPLFDAREPWAALAESEVTASAKKAAWCELVAHAMVGARSKPSNRWLAKAETLIAAIGSEEFVDLLQRWLSLLAKPPPDPRLSVKLFEGDNGNLLRGLTWAASRVDGAPVGAIGAAASACLIKYGGFGARSIKVANGCIWTLAAIASDDAIAELTRIKWTTEYASPCDLIHRLLAELADARGVARSQLELLHAVVPGGTSEDLDAELSRAERALEERSLERALEALLAAWRRSKTKDLAALITRLAAIANRDLEPIPDNTEESTSAAFATIAGDRRAIDVERLLARYPAPAMRRTEERASALSEFGDDPRIAVALAVHVTTATGGVPGSVWNTLVRIADPGVVELLTRATFNESGVADLIRDFRDNAVAAIRARSSGRVVMSDACEVQVARLAALVEAAAKRSASRHDVADDLLARIYADPSSDELRLIYADLLCETGDPRGEFITLQMAKKPSRNHRSRMKQLEREHGVAWLGPLAKAVLKTQLAYRRGFPATASLPKDPRRASNLMGRPEWSTFEILDLRESSFYGTALHTEFLLQPSLRYLREVRGLFVEQLLALLEHPEPLSLEKLDFTMRTANYEDGSSQAVAEAMDRCVSLPKLRWIQARGIARSPAMSASQLGKAIEIAFAP